MTDSPPMPQPFDADADPDEQLPRRLEVEVYEKRVGDKDYVFQRCNALFIGDRLTDNSLEQDDYRFHDVFHYAFVAVLGWSPVTRALMRLKRKSQPQIDDAEDGARAILIEEGVSTWVFGQAQRLNYFEGVGIGKLPLDLLKQIKQFVAGYEADRLLVSGGVSEGEQVVVAGIQRLRPGMAVKRAGSGQ